ncbi:MAG: hypothetical protein H7X88_02270 [Gloeobacteraceae cyanobacterium ES-bin-316]|nr:hypothetical protein [Ferruginibacter sp.]
MTRYNAFLTLFILSTISFFVCMGFYIQGIFSFVMRASATHDNDPLRMFSAILSPPLIVAFAVAAISSLACRITGIVMVMKNKTVSDGEKAIWIVGFVVMYFITSIVFLVLAKSRKYLEV